MYDHGGMNRFFRLVWSESKGCYIPIPEVSQKRGKRKGGLFASLAAAAVALLSAATGALADPGAVSVAPAVMPQIPPANALPTGGQVVGGNATITQSGNTQTITQTTQNAAIDWQSFDIGKDGKVVFNQPNASAIALNRVLGGDASKIYGVLDANGQVFLVNPNGVLFAKGSQVSTAGILASTRDMSVADFMAGKHRLSGTGNGVVINEGTLTAGTGGYVALVGAQVVNDGVITAAKGDVRLVAANDVTIRLDSGGFDLTIDQGAYDALVSNGGVIKADSGRIYLTADAYDALAKSSVNNTGIIEASSIATVGGKVVLTGDSITLAEGSRIDASGETGGGTVLVGGGWQGKDASIKNASTVLVAPDAVIDVSAKTTGDGGTAVLWSEDRTGFYGTIKATGGALGGNGGKVETSGRYQLQAMGAVDASAANGVAGQWLLDPVNVTIAAAGQSGTAYNATYDPNADSRILASAISDSLNAGTSVTITTGSTGSSAGDINVNSSILKSSGDAATLSLLAAGDININNSISSTSDRLNLVLTADSDADGAGNLSIGVTTKVLTNGGNFYVGHLTADDHTGTLVRRGQNVSLIYGSQINTTTADGLYAGLFAMGVFGTVTFEDSSITVAPDSHRNIYYNNGVQSNFGPSLHIDAGSITSDHSNSSNRDITTRVNTTLSADTGDIGQYYQSINLSGGDPADDGVAYSSLSISNTGGNTWVKEVGAQHSTSINLSIGNQANSEHHIDILDDAQGTGGGHIDLTTDGAGIVQVATNSVDLLGRGSPLEPMSLSLSAADINLGSMSIIMGAGSLTLNASNITGTNDGLEDVLGGNITLMGGNIGTAANPLELADTDYNGIFYQGTLNVYNSGGGTYVKSLYDGFGNITLDYAKAAGTHSILFSDGDHIDFTTDGTGIVTSTVGAASDGGTFGATTGIDLTRKHRNLTLNAQDGDILLGDDSIRMLGGYFHGIDAFSTTLTLGINRLNATGVIAAQNTYDSANPVAQITAGNVTFNVANDPTPAASTIGAGGQDIQIAKHSGDNLALTVNTQQGSVNIQEVTQDHFKSVNISLGQGQTNQTVAIGLMGDDDINFADDGTHIIVADNIWVGSLGRNFSLNAGQRTIRLDETYGGGGDYSLYAKILELNGSIGRGGHDISLTGTHGINVMNYVSIGTGHYQEAGSISLSTDYGNYGGSISGAVAGGYLSLNASSSQGTAGNITIGDMIDNRAGFYLSGLRLNAWSPMEYSGVNASGNVNINARQVLLDGEFWASRGATHVGYYNTDFVMDTDASNTAAGMVGSIRFEGDVTHQADRAATFDASATQLDTLAGEVMLGGAGSTSEFTASTLTVRTDGTAGLNYNMNFSRDITLGAVRTSGAQSYTGRDIELWGDLTSTNAAMTLNGTARLYQSVTLDSGSGAMTIGSIAGYNGMGTPALTIGKNDNSSSGSLSIGNVYGAFGYLDELTIYSSTDREITLGGIHTEGAQTYNGGVITLTADLSTNGGDIVFEGDSSFATTSHNIAFYTDRSDDWDGPNDAGQLILNGKALNGTGTLTIDTTGYDGGANADLALGAIGDTAAFSSIDIKAGAILINSEVKAAGDITFEARGSTANLEINFYGSVETTGTVNTITLSAGRDFVNSGYMNLLYGAGSRYLVYSASPTNTVEGMAGYSKHYNQTYTAGVTQSYATTGNWFLYSIAPVITVTSNANSVVYGSADPSLTLTNDNYSGFIDGDSRGPENQYLTLETGTLSGAGKRQVGTYAYTLDGTLTDSRGYQYVMSENLEVTKASVAVTGLSAVNREYDGTTAVSLTGTAVAGAAQTGDVLTIDASGITASITDKNAGTGKAVIIAGNGVLSGADAHNYDLTPATGLTVDVTKKTLSITGSAVSGKTYDGLTTATITAGILDGLVSNEELDVVASGAFVDKTAGMGKSVVTAYTLADGGNGGLASNYQLADETLLGDIAKLSISLFATGTDKIYDGSNSIAVTVGSNDILQGDTVNFTGTGTAFDKNVGTSKVVDVTDIASSDTDASNYDFSDYVGTTVNIDKRVINVSATGLRRYYDTTTAVGLYLTSADVINGDDITFSGGGTMADKNAGASKAVTVGTISVTGADGGNYDVTAPTSATVDIDAVMLTVAAIGQNRVYDGTDVVGVTLSSSDILDGDVVTFSGTGTAADKNAGTGKAVTVSNFATTGADAVNYTVTAPTTATVDISKKAITVAATGQDRVYDGLTVVGVTVSSDDIISGDTVTFTGIGAMDDKNAGLGKSVAVTAITSADADAANYDFGTTATTTVDIAKKSATVTATGQNKTYDGLTSVGVTLASVDILNGDTVAFTGTGAMADKNAGLGKSVAVSGIVSADADAANYDFGTTANTTVDIGKKSVTITATGQNKTYDASTSVGVTVVSADILNGDTVSFTGNGTIADKKAGLGKTVNVSGIASADADAANYDFSTTTTTTADIAKKSITVAAIGTNKTYDGSTSVGVTVASSDILNGDVVSFTGTGTAADKNAGNGKAVNVSGIASADADAANYDFGTTATTTVDIAKKSATVIATGQNKTYDGSTLVGVTLASADILNGDTVAFSGTGTASDKNAGTGKSVAVSGISGSGTDAGNYAYNSATATTVDITKKAIAVRANAQGKTYDGSTAVTVTLASDDIVTGDSVSFTGAGTASDKNAGTGKTVAVNGISSSGADASNYTHATTGVTTVDIAKKSVMVTANAQSKTYDGSAAVTVSVASDEILSGDTVAFTGTGTASDKNAGAGKVVSISNIAATGTDAGNYAYATTAATTVDIDTRAFEVSLLGPISKIGDGSTSVTLNSTNYLLSGLVAGETITVNQTTGQFADATAGKYKLVTAQLSNTHYVAGANTDLANYKLASVVLTTQTGEIVNPTSAGYDSALRSAVTNPAVTSPGATFSSLVGTSGPAVSTGDGNNAVATSDNAGGRGQSITVSPTNSGDTLAFRRAFTIADGGIRLPDGVGDSDTDE